MISSFARKKLTVVSNELPDPPYDKDLRVKGWRFQIDYERIEASDTWALAPPDMRPWLLMIWLTGWKQWPAGSLPNSDDIISARIGMELRMFQVHRDILMRGWILHSDNRYYHPVIVEQVLDYVNHCKREAQRKKGWRARMQNQENQTDNPDVPRDRHGTDMGLTTPEPEPELNKRIAKAILSDTPKGVPDLLGDVGMDQGGKPDGRKRTGQQKVAAICPHQEIIRLYHEILPELPGIIVSRWRGSKSEIYLRTRWNEDIRHQNLDFWRRFFQAVRTNTWWMGNNEKAWMASLHWLVNRSNFDKVLSHMVNNANNQEATRV